ncbi:MAG: TonB-dependent receptor [Opitutaceae bacterium]|jgi:outer membrane receptor protein involved in Fe transport|nr:TonB-dependent receptor [Opitutaceae bacterium]
MKPPHTTIALAVLLAAAAGVSAPAQRAPSAPPPDEEIVILSPFEVNSAKTTGYMAAEGATGTRYAAPIMEVPISVQAITSEFLEDFFLLDLAEVTAYTSGFIVNNNGGTDAFNVRGIRSYGTGTYRNGLKSDGIYGPVAVDRIEIVRGPNAAIYGATEPSGLRNIVTKNPTAKPFARIRLAAGTDDFYRVALDLNTPVTKRTLFTRFAYSVEESGQYLQDFTHYRRKNFYNATTWKIGPKTTFSYHLDYVWYRNQAQMAGSMPFVQAEVELPDASGGITAKDAIIGYFGSGLFQQYQNLNSSGRGASTEMEFTQLDANLTHQFSRWLSLRVLAGRIQRNQDILRSQGAGNYRDIYDPASGTIMRLTGMGPYGGSIYYYLSRGAGANGGTLGGVTIPQIERNRLTQTSVQADLLAQFNTGPLAHKLLLTADYSISDNTGRTRRSVVRDPSDATQLPGNPATWKTWNGAVTLNDSFWGDWSFTNPSFDYAFDFFNTEKWNHDQLWTEQQRITKGIMLSERISLFGNRLIAFVGGRHDEMSITLINHLQIAYDFNQAVPAIYAPGTQVRYPGDRADTFQSGLLYKLTPALSLYVNYSESFNPTSRTDGANRDFYHNPLPAQRGAGYEIGLKAALFDQRLNFTLTWFDTDKTKVPRVALDDDGYTRLPSYFGDTSNGFSYTNDINTRGVELDLNARPTPALSIIFALCYNEVSFTRVQNPTEQYLLNVPPDATPKWLGSLALTYKVGQGPLKGMNFRLGARYIGEQIVSNNAGTASVFGNSKYKAPYDSRYNDIGGRTYDRYYFENPAYILVEGGFGYGWRTGKTRHGASLNVRNLLNQKYMSGLRPGIPMSLILSYDITL